MLRIIHIVWQEVNNMGKFYRYKLPTWLCKIVNILEKAIVPILVFQLIRTLFITTTLDLIILTLLIILFILFYVQWL